jgi:DNA replication protein DnaC
MMDVLKCKKLLADRLNHLKWADKNPDGTLKSYHMGLYLLTGDFVAPRGWTLREIEEAHLPGHEVPLAERAAVRLQAMHDYWFPIWDGIDAERVKERALAAAEKNKERALAAAEKESNERYERWFDFGPPQRYSDGATNEFDIEKPQDKVALDAVMGFSELSHDTLALLGSPGTRKTQLAAKWLRKKIMDDGEDGQFISAADLVRDARNAELIERYCTVDNLVIDDIAVYAGDVEIVLRVVDARLNNSLATVYTTNAKRAELLKIYGPRGFSRLTCNGLSVVMSGRDWRQRHP